MSSTAAGEDPNHPGAFNTISAEGVFTAENEQAAVISLIDNGSIMINQGFNNITVNPPNSTVNTVIFGEGYSTPNLGSVDGNWWGAGVAPSPSGSSFWGASVFISGITWTATVGGTSSWTGVPIGETCPSYSGSAVADKGGAPHPLSLADSSTCANLWKTWWEYDEQNQWQAIYDTGKYFVEHCYNDAYHCNLVFDDMQGAVQVLANQDTSLYVEYRQWLESVLYLNTTDPGYFCGCVLQIAGTYNSFSDTSETLYWKDENRGLAIGKWLMDHNLCDSDGIFQNYNATRLSQHEDWLNDTTVPYDTTLPSMHDLGLDTLLAKHFLYEQVWESTPPEIITNAFASPNPVNTGTVISFTMSKEAYVKIQLYDVLGHSLSGAGFEGLFQPGNKEVPISLQDLPSGTYYARIVTAYGEVQTVKLVKE